MKTPHLPWKTAGLTLATLLFLPITLLAGPGSLPGISTIPNLRTFPNLPSRTVTFSLTNADTASFGVTSADANLAPPGNIIIAGSGSSRTLTVIPGTNDTGTTTISLTVTNEFGLIAGETFNFTVGSFSQDVTNLPGLTQGVVSWVDFENDDRLDLLISGNDNNYGPETHLYHNNGDGTFTDMQLSVTNLPFTFTNALITSADWADFDGDGYADLVADINNWTYVFKNNGGTNLTLVASLTTPWLLSSVIWADVDNDGRPDILDVMSAATWVYHNNGNGTFSMVSQFSGGGNSAAADYDGDGRIDLMVMGAGLLRNVGTNGFVNSGLTFPSFDGVVSWADVNNDGRPDLLMTGDDMNDPSGELTALYLNNGGSFTLIATNLPSLRNSILGCAAWGDVDNDGYSDIFLTGFGANGSEGKIYRNNGNETFTDLGVNFPGFNYGSAAWGDYDNDGALDLIVIGNPNGGPAATQLYHNDGAMPDTPPTAPTGLTVTLGFNSVLLTWNAATDAEQSGGLTYNVRVGTVTNGINLMSPLSDLATGYRRVPKAGNAGYRTSLLITNLPAGTYYWSVQAIDNSFEGSVFAGEQNFTLPAPVITNQPQNVTVLQGSPATFTVGATGPSPLYYQWLSNGTNLAGATNSSLTISPALFADQGIFAVTVSNVYGSVTSSNVSLTVLTPPSLTSEPVSVTNVVGNWASFSVSATGTAPFVYNWYQNGNQLSDGGRVFGSGSNILTIASTLTNDAGFYWVVVSNNYGSATSSIVSLSMSMPEWLLNVDFGSGSQSLKIGPAAVGQTANDFWNFYDVGDTNITGLLLANGVATPISVSVAGAGPTAPSNGNPDPMYGQFLYEGGIPGNLTLTTSNLPPGIYNFYYYAGCGDMEYQLSVNGATVGGLQYVSNADTASTNWQEGLQYTAFQSVVLTSSVSTVQTIIKASAEACLGAPVAVLAGMQIDATFANPIFLSQPASQIVYAGSNATLSATVITGTPIGYQWLDNGTPMMDGGRITGSAGTALVISNAQLSDSGTYELVATNAYGTGSSSNALLTVIPLSITQPQNQSVLGGATVNFSVTPTGQQPFSYQWLFNGTSLPGATNDPLVLTNVLVSQAGPYSVQVANMYGTVSSSNASLTVVPFSITTQPTSRITWLNGPAKFTVNVSGAPPFGFNWQLNGMGVPVTLTNILPITNAQLSQFGTYDVVITNAYGSITSSNATLSFSQVAVWGGTDGESNLTPGLTNVTEIAGGISGAIDCLVLRSDGSVVHWPQTNVLAITNILAIVGEAVDAYPLFLRTNETVAELLPNDVLEPVQGLNNVVAIAPEFYALMALATNGAIVPRGVAPSLTNVVAIAQGNGHSLALIANGTVTASGSNTYGQTNVPAGLSNVVAIAAGYYHSLALKSDGTVVAWGNNTYGQTNVPPGVSNVVAISAGLYHSLALCANGTVKVWGNNFYGQTNVPAGLTNVIAIAAGQNHCMALVGNGPPALGTPLLNPNSSINGFRFSLPSQSGRVYVLQYLNSLSGSNWISLPLVPGNGGTLVLTDPTATNNQQRFYRVQRW